MDLLDLEFRVEILEFRNNFLSLGGKIYVNEKYRNICLKTTKNNGFLVQEGKLLEFSKKT